MSSKRKPYQSEPEPEKVQCNVCQTWKETGVFVVIFIFAGICAFGIIKSIEFFVTTADKNNTVDELQDQIRDLNQEVSDLKADIAALQSVNTTPSTPVTLSNGDPWDGGQWISSQDKGWLCTRDIPNNRWGCEQSTDDPGNLGLKITPAIAS